MGPFNAVVAFWTTCAATAVTCPRPRQQQTGAVKPWASEVASAQTYNRPTRPCSYGSPLDNKTFRRTAPIRPPSPVGRPCAPLGYIDNGSPSFCQPPLVGVPSRPSRVEMLRPSTFNRSSRPSRHKTLVAMATSGQAVIPAYIRLTRTYDTSLDAYETLVW